ncbi:MAG: hypothetical protein QME12_00040 [Nanoarchaeota archaeon]|nr:hypothetical protein [Nanoarchaeota archaeon]
MDSLRKRQLIGGIALFAVILLISMYYFPRGTLKVTVTGSDYNPLSGAEVWIWDKSDFEGKPEKVVKADANGIAEIKLFRGEYAVSLASELNTNKEEAPVKFVTFLEIKRNTLFELPLMKQR